MRDVVDRFVDIVATGTSARCRPDAMNEKFRKVDTHLHGMYYGAI